MIRAAAVVANVRFSFKGMKVCIIRGICGGVPTTAYGVEIILGSRRAQTYRYLKTDPCRMKLFVNQALRWAICLALRTNFRVRFSS
jgi:hypothetical protein